MKNMIFFPLHKMVYRTRSRHLKVLYISPNDESSRVLGYNVRKIY